MAQAGVVSLVINPYPTGTDNTQRNLILEGPLNIGSSVEAQTISITAWSITSNVVTFTASNTLDGTEQIIVSGFSEAYLNGTFTLTSATSTTMVAPLVHANGSATEAGTATVNRAAAPIAITSYQVATNVLTLQAVNDLTGTETITVSGFAAGNAFVNGTYALSSATATTLVMALTHADAGPTTAAGIAIVTPQYVTNGLPISYTFINPTLGGTAIPDIGSGAVPHWIDVKSALGGAYNYKVNTTIVPNLLRIYNGITELTSAANIAGDTIVYRAEFTRGVGGSGY